MSKYRKLREHLANIPPDVMEKTLSFGKIQKIIDGKLPPSAYEHRAWWANSSSPKQHPHAQSWLTAGWKVENVNQSVEWVQFQRSTEIKFELINSITQSENSLNPSKGKQFQIISGQMLSKRFSIDFQLEFPILIGHPPKEHKFDLASPDQKYVGECKNYSWTKAGNVPAAKMGFTNEAVFYLSFLPKETYRFVILRKATHPKRSESLAEYYYRTNKHLLQGVRVLELNLEDNSIREIGKN